MAGGMNTTWFRLAKNTLKIAHYRTYINCICHVVFIYWENESETSHRIIAVKHWSAWNSRCSIKRLPERPNRSEVGRLDFMSFVFILLGLNHCNITARWFPFPKDYLLSVLLHESHHRRADFLFHHSYLFIWAKISKHCHVIYLWIIIYQ